MAETFYIDAVASMGTTLNPKNKPRSKAIESAMSAAVMDCLANGVTDPVEQRAAMKAAADAVRSRYDAEDARA